MNPQFCRISTASTKSLGRLPFSLLKSVTLINFAEAKLIGFPLLDIKKLAISVNSGPCCESDIKHRIRYPNNVFSLFHCIFSFGV